MTYASYEFYATVYAGDMSEKDYVKWSGRATSYIDAMTHGRAATAPDEMKHALSLCFCAIIDCIKAEEDAKAATENGSIKSATNDGISVTYADGTSQVTYANRRLNLCHAYLCYPVNLMCGWI